MELPTALRYSCIKRAKVYALHRIYLIPDLNVYKISPTGNLTIDIEVKESTETNNSASYLDIMLFYDTDGHMKTSLYDEREDFNFSITNFPFLSSNIPSSPAYGVFISQLIRYA